MLKEEENESKENNNIQIMNEKMIKADGILTVNQTLTVGKIVSQKLYVYSSEYPICENSNINLGIPTKNAKNVIYSFINIFITIKKKI